MPEPTEPAKKPEATQPIGELMEKTASEVRKEPVKAIIWAFFVGIFLTVFPVGRILRLVIGVAVSLVRPALLLLGVKKFCEEIEERRK